MIQFAICIVEVYKRNSQSDREEGKFMIPFKFSKLLIFLET